jgi:hypothetical protein
MTTEVKVNIGINGVNLETESGFGAWSKEFLGFDYDDWTVYVESINYVAHDDLTYVESINYVAHDLTLQFTDDGKILFSCDSYNCNDDDEDSEGCCEYKNFEITGYYIIQNDYFLIKFIKSQKPAE